MKIFKSTDKVGDLTVEQLREIIREEVAYCILLSKDEKTPNIRQKVKKIMSLISFWHK